MPDLTWPQAVVMVANAAAFAAIWWAIAWGIVQAIRAVQRSDYD